MALVQFEYATDCNAYRNVWTRCTPKLSAEVIQQSTVFVQRYGSVVGYRYKFVGMHEGKHRFEHIKRVQEALVFRPIVDMTIDLQLWDDHEYIEVEGLDEHNHMVGHAISVPKNATIKTALDRIKKQYVGLGIMSGPANLKLTVGKINGNRQIAKYWPVRGRAAVKQIMKKPSKK
jgi:hypothetical protein